MVNITVLEKKKSGLGASTSPAKNVSFLFSAIIMPYLQQNYNWKMCSFFIQKNLIQFFLN